MSCSRIISAGTAEDKIKRNFYLVHKLHRTFLSSRYRNSDQKRRFKAGSSTSSFQRRNLIYITCRNKRGTLSQISSDDRSAHRVLSERRGSLLVRRAIRADLVIVRSSVTSLADSITVPCGNLCHTQRIVNSHLPKRGQPEFDSRNTDLIEQPCNMGILRGRSEDIPHT